MKELYTVEVNNRFQALQDLEENVKNLNTICTNIISAHEDVVRKYIPVLNKVKGCACYIFLSLFLGLNKSTC